MNGLEARIPEKGRAADCYAVARTAQLLMEHAIAQTPKHEGRDYAPSRHACELHRISGALGGIAVRECNEDLTCERCGGAGQLPEGEDPYGKTCPQCAGDGRSLGKRKAKLRAAAEQIAEHYGFRCYFQTDPRGCALYLIDPADAPAEARPMVGNAARERATADWIDANYSRGHAVVRLGR